MSDTPRTDFVAHAKAWANGAKDKIVQLECELVTARAELAELREELNDRRKFAYAVEQALDGLKGDYVEIILALRKDAAMKEGGK